MALRLSAEAANAAVNAIAALCNGGKLRIYTTPRPTTVADPVGGATLLAELGLNATAFGAASGGVATANAITQDVSADNTGTAAWCRIFKSDGSTAVYDGSVGTSGENLNLNSASISAGTQVSVSSLTLTQPLA